MDPKPQTPRLFLTSMSNGDAESLVNAKEIIGPIHHLIDGVIWVLHDASPDAPVAQYLEGVKKQGKVIHRAWPKSRHFHSMNETLWSGPVEVDDLVIWTDPLERPMPDFVGKIKEAILPLMLESETDCIFFYGKPFLFRYSEALEYRNTPHWTLTNISGRVIEWSEIDNDESKVRLNVRPGKRKDPFHFVRHYLRYFIEYPVGSNSALLGLDKWPDGVTKDNWIARETNRLKVREGLRTRGFPVTVAGFLAMCEVGLDDEMKEMLNFDKTFTDAWWHLVKGRTEGIRDSHDPADNNPIP